MATLGKSRTGFLVSIVLGVVATAMLFVALPLLTQIQKKFHSQRDMTQSVLLSNRKPPPPPSEDRDMPKEQKIIEKEIRKTSRQPLKTQPKFDIPKVGLGLGVGNIGGIEIGKVAEFRVSDSLFMSAFNITEVDQPPRAIRSFPPQYPYRAKRDNIEGHVLLKFVVDTDGIAKEMEVEESEPEGIFDEAALKALERYKFKPAIKNGKVVLCIVRLPISFRLD